jgi:hypothetical protein
MTSASVGGGPAMVRPLEPPHLIAPREHSCGETVGYRVRATEKQRQSGTARECSTASACGVRRKASVAECAFPPPRSWPDSQSAPNGQAIAHLVRHCSRSVGWAMRPQRRVTVPEFGFGKAGLEQIGFEAQERQRVIRRCALSVKCSESATVIRSTSVVLTELWPPRRSNAHQTHCLLGRSLPLRVVCPNKVGSRAGVAQSVERQPSKLNVAGSRPVSRSTSHFVPGTTLSLFGAIGAKAVDGRYNAQPPLGPLNRHRVAVQAMFFCQHQSASADEGEIALALPGGSACPRGRSREEVTS